MNSYIPEFYRSKCSLRRLRIAKAKEMVSQEAEFNLIMNIYVYVRGYCGTMIHPSTYNLALDPLSTLHLINPLGFD